MKKTIDITKTFPKHSFWDMDYSKLSIEKDKDLIIPRALFFTTKTTFKKDIAILESLYSKEQILNCLKSTKERISNNVCVMVAKKYKVTPFYRYSL